MNDHAMSDSTRICMLSMPYYVIKYTNHGDKNKVKC